jgi:hypothetical protein
MAPGDDAYLPKIKQVKKNDENRTLKLLRRMITADMIDLKDRNGMISRQYLEALTSLARHVKAYSSLSSCGYHTGDACTLESANRILGDAYLRLQQAEESTTLDLRRARTRVRTNELRASIHQKLPRRIAHRKTLRARHALDGKDTQAQESLARDQARWGQEPLRILLKARKSHALDSEDKQAEGSMARDQARFGQEPLRIILKARKSHTLDDEVEQAEESLARDQARWGQEPLRIILKARKSHTLDDEVEQGEESMVLVRIKLKRSKSEAVKRSRSLKAIASKRSGPKKF